MERPPRSEPPGRGARLITALILVLSSREVVRAADQIPRVDLQRLERPVATQLESVRELLKDVCQRPETTPVQRGVAFGEFGRILHAYGYFAEAASCYEQATRSVPDEARWWHLLGVAREQEGAIPAAITAYREAIRREERSATGLRLAGALTQSRVTRDAQEIYERLLAADEDLAAAHAGLGLLLLEQRDYEPAIRHLSRALELVPAATRLHYPLAMAYRGAGQLDRAREELKHRGSAGLRPADPWVDDLAELIQGSQVHLLRGRLALSAGAVADAVDEFRRAVNANPDFAPARVNLAVALVQSGDLDEAVACLQETLRREPDNVAATFNLAAIEMSRQQFTAAIARLEPLCLQRPRDLEAGRMLGQCYRAQGDGERSLTLARRLHEDTPEDETTLLFFVECLQQQRQFTEAGRLLQRQNQRFPGRVRTARALARLLATCPEPEHRDGRRAVDLILPILKVQPSLDDSETLAMGLAAAGQFDEAVRLQTELITAARELSDQTVAERLERNRQRYKQQQTAE